MSSCIKIKADLRKQISATMQIQLEVFHYHKILLLGLSEEGACKPLLQSDKKKYNTFDIKPPAQNRKKILFKSRLKKSQPQHALCEFYDVNALFPIIPADRCLAYMAIKSDIPTYTDRQVEVSSFIADYIGSLLRNDTLVDDLKTYSTRMQKLLNEMGTLHEITHALESSDNIDSLLEYIMKKSQNVMKAEAASLMLVIPETNELEFKVVLGPKATEVKPFRLPIGQGIAGWVAQSGEPVLIPDCYSDPRFDPSFDKRSGFRTRSMLCVPMIYKSKTVGVMSIINRTDGNPFNKNDQMLFTIFASQAALSIENARLLFAAIEKERLDKELQVAAEIQKLLIPQSIPQSDFLEISAEYIPCKEVGGDFYDIIRLDENRFIFAVADVSGKGIPGAMVVSNMQAKLRAYLEYSADLIPVVEKLNEAIIRQTTSDRYITFFIGLYDHAHASFTYINAGHNPPVLINRDGSLKELRKGGIFIGYVPWEYESETVILEPGDTLVLYTDGLVEAMNEKEEEFEFKRLKQLLSDNKNADTESLKELIIGQVDEHIGTNPLEDDFTLLITRRTGA